MATRKSPGAAADSGPDRYASLRRAQLAFESLDQPDVSLPARRAAQGPPEAFGVSPASAAPSSAGPSVAKGLPGLVHSQPGRPPLETAAHVVTATSGMRITPAGSAFERLKMGQERLSRSAGKPSSDADADSTKTVALDREAFDDIQRQARLHHTLVLLNTVSAYFKCSPAELQAEQARLGQMTSVQLDAVTRSYDHAAKQVMVTTDEVQAQKTARDTSRDIKLFYEQNGTTESVIDSERPRPGARPHP